MFFTWDLVGQHMVNVAGMACVSRGLGWIRIRKEGLLNMEAGDK